jgi:hypothetical protein
MDTNFKDGIRLVTVSSWREFQQQALALHSKRGFVWRGQRQDWILQANFDRDFPTNNAQERYQKLEANLTEFRNRMEKSYPNILPADDTEAWALGQHYGLKTPLLDWTLSPHIAAYFAFVGLDDANDPDPAHRFVYALDRSIERLVSKQKRGTHVLSREQSVPFIDQLALPSPRFTRQQSVFTNGLRGKSINEFIDSFAHKRPANLSLVKFKIPARFRDEILADLHARGIDHTTLLLDLRTVVDACNGLLLTGAA